MNPDIVAMVLIFIVTIVPVAGITARFTLKPVLEVMLRLREASTPPQQSVSDKRLELIASELQRLGEAVERLEEGREFERQLAPGYAAPRLREPGSAPRA